MSSRTPASWTAPATPAWRALPLFLLLLGSLATSLQGFSRGLWLDEAWVANSVAADDLHGMFYYAPWVQTTPPLFLLLVRILVEAVGLSDLTLKILPLIFGLAAIAVFALLAVRMFGEQLAFLTTIPVAFSPLTLANSQTLKQYSGELFAACVVLLLSWNYLNLPTRWRYWVLVAASCLLAGLSYSLAMVLPVAGACLLLADTNRKTKLLRTTGFGLLCGAALIGLYFLFVKPNSDPSLHGFWESDFPRGGWLGHASFYFDRVVHIYSALLLPGSASTRISEPLSWITAVVAVAGIVASINGLRGSSVADRTSRFHLLTFLPLLALIGLNVLGKYPMGAGRTAIFLLPCIAIWLGRSAQALWKWLPVSGTAIARLGVARWVPLSAILAIVLSSAITWKMHTRERGLWEDTEGALRSIRSASAPDDLLYVHASLTEPAKLYFAMLKWSPSHVLFGRTGSPCCQRISGARSIDAEQRYLVDAVKRTNDTKSNGRVWVLATGRLTHWAWLGRNDFEVMDAGLRQTGCLPEDSPEFHNVLARRYECRGAVSGQP